MNSPLPLILLAAAAPAFAQSLLDPLVVTASRSEQESSQTPYSTTMLDADYLRENTRRTLPDALQYTPGILIQKTAHGHGSPFIRGFTGRQNLLLVDGVRVNNSTFRSGAVQYWNTVDSLAIDHLELIKSQGSVLYGSDAIGGTLNAFTKSSDFRSKPADQFYQAGSAAYEYRSNGQGSHIGRLEAETGIGGQFGAWLGISTKEFGDIEDSAVGRMKNTGYPEKDLDLRFDWALSPHSTVTLAHHSINQDDVSRWHRTSENPGWTHGSHVATPGTWAADTYDQERSLTYLRYAGENATAQAPIQRWSSTLSFQTSADSEFQNRTGDPSAGSQPIRNTSIDLQTTGLDLLLESAVGPGSLVYGVDYYHDEVDSFGSKNNLAGTRYAESLPIADDSQYDLLGAYAQYIWQTTERLEITSGARYTLAQAHLGRFAGGTDQSREWDATVGSLRGSYAVNDAWNLFGGVAQAFRAPNLDDLSGNLVSKSGNTALGAVDVNPEHFLTYELGTRHHTENTSLSLAVFYTDVQDLIVSAYTDPSLKTSIATNAGDGYMKGVELEGAWRFQPQWTLSGFTAWQDGRTQSPSYVGGAITDKPNSRLLPLSGSLALRWDDPSKKIWIEGRILGAIAEDRIDPVDQAADSQRVPTGGTPGYLVTSLRAGWSVTPRLNLTCGIENLTDEDYRNHGSGQNEPGVNGIFGAKVTW
ncbi:MAG: TonB-dependent receptor [Akkermansiaceae bacterium]|nr:TonB-dependent receptor [Akkermansiaceae bacterium]